MKICIVGASGKLGKYMVRHALDRGYEVVGVCRERSVEKLEAFKESITIVPGATNNREVIKNGVAGCDGVLTVLVPWGSHHYSTGTAQAVLDYAPPGARLIFSCGWHITRDDLDVYPRRLKLEESVGRWIGRLTRLVDIDDQIEACRRVFASDTLWTVVRGSDRGLSCAEATSKRARARGCPCGVPTWVTPSSRATLRAAWTMRCSW